MPFVKGAPRPPNAGRKKGTPNRKTVERRKQEAELLHEVKNELPRGFAQYRSASGPQQGAEELPGFMKRDRASSTDLEAGRLTGLARSRSGHCPIPEAMKRHGFRETVKPLDR